jgi:uncharacterized 2Fe-2S/4Fe-4S cluster protein (DUF4445 family)
MKITFQPLGKRVDVFETSTILDAAHQAGIDLAAVCGGGGTCHACKIRTIDGDMTPAGEDEKSWLGMGNLEAGYRLACQCFPITDCKIEIPPESLNTSQRTQIEGTDSGVVLNPAVQKIHLEILPPNNSDLLSDDKRIINAILEKEDSSRVQISHGVLVGLSGIIRKQNWSGSFILDKSSPLELVGLSPVNARLLGLAGDLGSTKLALYLVDLESGETLAKIGAMNPQISFGEDVVNRIAFTNKHPEGRKVLQGRLIETINNLTLEMCHETGTQPQWIANVVMVGNTAMHHFFAGLPVEQLALSPYIASVSDPMNFKANEIGLTSAPGANVYLPPNLAGFVGADHVSMLLAAGSWTGDKTLLSIDIGTNTEISLLTKGLLFSCSCASGPAFEGAHIQSGMRAAPGAIERVKINNGKIYLQTIEGLQPIGICGSGILEVISEMKTAGVIDERGVFNKASQFVDCSSGKGKFVLVPADATANNEEINISRNDINQIQLAKAAIRAGIEILMKTGGINAGVIDQCIIAGAFGTYLDIADSINIGMFPDLPLERFSQIGNAAGVGARQMLLSRDKRREAEEIASRMSYIELTNHPDFTEIYLDALYIRQG